MSVFDRICNVIHWVSGVAGLVVGLAAYIVGDVLLGTAATAFGLASTGAVDLIQLKRRVKVLEAELREDAVERHPAKGGQS